MRKGSELVFETNWTTGRELFVRINDKTYISMEYVLKVIDDTIRAVSLSGIDRNLIMLGTLLEVKDKFLALEGGAE